MAAVPGCACLREIREMCERTSSSNGTAPRMHSNLFASAKADWVVADSEDEMGRIAYTVAILLIFALIIIVVMFRTIKRSSSTVEMEALLDAMRFREELDIQQRQRKRLMKAKTKVSAWLTKTGGGGGPGAAEAARLWKSSPMLLPPRKATSSSVMSDVPEIVVTDDIHRAHTPALSLIYDFDGSARHSVASSSHFNSLASVTLEDGLISAPTSRKRSSLRSLKPQADSFPE